MKHLTLSVAALLALLAAPAQAEIPVIDAVSAARTGSTWRFAVTLTHPDSGWEHYADGWEVLDADGNVLGHRTLVHPHGFNEPFTRSLAGVEIPDGITTVYLRAHCLVDGWGPADFAVDLPQ